MTTIDNIEERYEFVDELGDGSSSQVYLASTAPHEVPGREVAIKVLDVNALLNDSEQLDAVRAETQLLRALRHPHIVHFFETCRDGSSFAVVTEALTGGDLFQRLKENGAPLREGVARGIFAQVCNALEHLHRCGYAHRDIKAENVVCVDGKKQRDAVKLIDFGSSAPTRDKNGVTVPLTGLHATAHYCAPEVAASSGGLRGVNATGRPYDERCDMYSLGVLLYFLLSRKLPFAAPSARPVGRAPSDGAEDEDGLLRRVAEGNYAFEPPLVWERVSVEAKDLIAKLMTKRPEHRLDWKGVHSHPWCTSAVQECEAAVDKWFDTEGLARPKGRAVAKARRANVAATRAHQRLQLLLGPRRRRACIPAIMCCRCSAAPGARADDSERTVAII
jgi:serine/threonine protein kinase